MGSLQGSIFRLLSLHPPQKQVSPYQTEGSRDTVWGVGSREAWVLSLILSHLLLSAELGPL